MHIDSHSSQMKGQDCISTCRVCLQVYVGADQLSIDTLDAGMDGVIGGGGSSVMAKIFVDIWHLYKSGDKEQAQKLQDRMNQWCVPPWPAR